MKQDSLFSARPAPPPEAVQGVSRVVGYLKRLIETNKTLAGLRVRGEVSERNESAGHIYFSLKEGNDVLRCVVWASTASKLEPFKNGEEIICSGDFTAYTARSVYELIVRSFERTGTGALYAQFEALKERFRKEGLFEPERKRALPLLPRRVAVVSARAKGAEDFLTTVAREAPFVELHFVETRVQGEGAEIEIAQAIDRASKMEVDVIVLTRGGGSYEDLFAFNREPVVRAILRARHPVVSAIGHTEDQHLSDLVADVTFGTPSNAAHYFGDIGKAFRRDLQTARSRMERSARLLITNGMHAFDRIRYALREAAQAGLRERAAALQALDRRLAAQAPDRRLALRAERVVELRTRLDLAAPRIAAVGAERLKSSCRALDAAVGSLLRTLQQRCEMLAAQLRGADPMAPLGRGYAIVSLGGKALRDAANAPRGSLVGIRLLHGELLARVEGASEDE